MRSLVCTFILAAAAAHASAQTPGQPAQAVRGDGQGCPDVRVTFGGGAAVVGGRVKFSAAVSAVPATPPAALTYRWQVSTGAIVSGDGGPELEVDPRGMTGSGITATVRVGGLPPNCLDTASLDLPIFLCALPFDTVGKLPRLDEQARLDSFAATLASEAGTVGYVIAYGGRRGPRGDARARLERMRRHLVGKRGLPEGRIVSIDGGYREEAATEFWFVPVEAAPPAPTPTLDPGVVEFTDRRPGRRRAKQPRVRRSSGSG